MRSEIVFRAQDTLSNRYQLCRTTAKVTRLLNFVSHCTTDAINDAFMQVANPRSSDADTPLAQDTFAGYVESEEVVLRVA